MKVRNSLKAMRLAAFAGVLLVAAVPAVGQDRRSDDRSPSGSVERLHELASQAGTAKEHAAVAKQYRLHAEAFETQAKKHEQKVAKFAGQQWFHKWPGMAPQWLQKEKQAAVEARRAARECYTLADRHVVLAVERQAVD